MRQPRRHRPADPRRRRLARFTASRRARQHRAPAASPRPVAPHNSVLLPLPPYAPELNSVENIWEYLRSNWFSHCVWDTYEAILDACCDAWNALMAKSEIITSIGTRDWAQVKI